MLTLKVFVIALFAVAAVPTIESAGSWTQESLGELEEIVIDDEVSENCATNCYGCKANGEGTCDDGQCFLRYGPNTNQCQDCAKNCIKCSSTKSGACDAGFCVTGYEYKLDDETCKPQECTCISNCQECPKSSRFCEKCKPGYAANRRNGLCEECDPNCFECEYNGGGKCDPEKCHQGYEFDERTNECIPSKCTGIPNCKRCHNKVSCDLCEFPYEVDNDKLCSMAKEHCDSDVGFHTGQGSLSARSRSKSRSVLDQSDYWRNLADSTLVTYRSNLTGYCIEYLNNPRLKVFLMDFMIEYHDIQNYTFKLDSNIIVRDTNLQEARRIKKGGADEARALYLEFHSFPLNPRKYFKINLKGDVCCFVGCPDNCLSCQYGVCLLCHEGYGLVNGACKPCPKNCLDCNEHGKCTKCPTDFVLTNNDICISGQHSVVIPYYFSACSCRTCQLIKFNKNYICYATCPLFQGLDVATHTCKACGEHCVKCTFAGQCDETGCQRGYVFDRITKTCSATRCTTVDKCVDCSEHKNICSVCETPYKPHPVTGQCTVLPDQCGSLHDEVYLEIGNHDFLRRVAPMSENTEMYSFCLRDTNTCHGIQNYNAHCRGQLPYLRVIEFEHENTISSKITVDGENLVLEENKPFQSFHINRVVDNVEIQTKVNRTLAFAKDFRSKIVGRVCCL